MEELLKKEHPYINSIALEELFMKLESRGIIHVFKVSKSKKMVVYNKDNKHIRKEIMEE